MVALPILAAVVVAIVVLARNNRERDEGEKDTVLTHRDDDKYWHGGLVYINREDHALMVPRRFGLGRRQIRAPSILVVLGPQLRRVTSENQGSACQRITR